jgi:hypothetical protein
MTVADTFAPQWWADLPACQRSGSGLLISTWQVRNEKLYLNLNQDILKQFNANFEGNVAKANKNWPRLVKKNSEPRETGGLNLKAKTWDGIVRRSDK